MLPLFKLDFLRRGAGLQIYGSQTRFSSFTSPRIVRELCIYLKSALNLTVLSIRSSDVYLGKWVGENKSKIPNKATERKINLFFGNSFI